MPITISQKGDFSLTYKFLKKNEFVQKLIAKKLEKYGQMGVEALSQATPKDTGKTASSWSYEVITKPGYTSIIWKNSNFSNWANVAVLIQYGHATKNGGFVQGIDYINPALKPLFDKMAKDIWLEVSTDK